MAATFHADEAYWTSVDETRLADATLERARKARAALDELRRDYALKASQIENNREFTHEGKNARLGELRHAAAQQLAARVVVEIDQIARDTEQLDARRLPPKPSGDPIVAELRGREIRDYVSRLDPVERPAALFEHARRGDDGFLLAIENSPTVPLCDGATLREARSIRAATVWPDITLILRETVKAETALRLMTQDFERELMSDSAADPIKALAVGPLPVQRDDDPAVDREARRRGPLAPRAGDE